MEFGRPLFLLLFLLAPYFVFLAVRSRSGIERGRSIVSTVLRVLLFAALVLSLADARRVSRSYRTATLFLLDHSFSIPQDVQSRAIEWINERLGEVPEDDTAGVILFGNEAMIETPASPKPAQVGPNSVVGRSATDLGAAIRLALAIFPEGYQRRLVVVSDANENRGHALGEVEMARAHGVTIDFLPLTYTYEGEVRIERLHVPAEVKPREPYDATVVIHSERAGPASLAVYRNGELLTMEKVTLVPGKNLFAVPQKVEAPGSFSYRAVVEMEGDQVSQNNVAHASAAARGEARVAVVPGEEADAEHLVPALVEEGIHAVVLPPAELMAGRVDVAAFDAVVFANVEAAQVGRKGMRAVEAAVHDAGVGFLMIGGERSFGPGGFRSSPIEEALPVTMEQPQRRVMPNGALALILHTVEIPQGNFWTKKIGIAALDVLNSKDYMGALIYDWEQGDSWLFKMQPVADKARLRRLINNAQPGDMPTFDPTLQLAHQGMKNLPAASKHIVVISDADPSGPSKQLIDAIVADKITISTVAIGPHGGSDIDKMRKIAQRARGRFYLVNNPAQLPQIFIKEAATIQRSMVIEGRITPKVLGSVEALKGIAPSEIPALHGYTLTNPRPLARVSMGMPVPKSNPGDKGPATDVLLADWTYGLGRTMAFTSDAKARWGRDWVGWVNYRKFWSQAVRSILRTVPRSPYSLQTEIEGGKGRVTLDAIDAEGDFIESLRFKGASVTAPSGDKQELAFRQVGPGRYEAVFDADEVGVYALAGNFEDDHGKQGFLSQGIPLAYAAEYRDLKTNDTLIDQVVGRTGGRRLDDPETPIYVPLPLASGMAMPLWPYLLAALLALWPIDIFIRRVAVDWAAVWRKLRMRKPKPARRGEEVPETIAALSAAKRGVQEARLEGPEEEVDLEAMAEGRSSRPAEPAAEEAGAESRPPEPKPEEPKPEEADDYMGRLLKAKRKAKDKQD